MPLAPGIRIGQYEVIAPLGTGGMGEVYRARDPRLGRDVAIKALPESLEHDPERLARFEREARLLASLSHANIAGIHGLEESAGRRYLVLEFIEGQTLAQRLSQGPLPVDEALTVCRDIAAGVEAAHEGGIVHRDLKPGNVMITTSGAVKVLDFGLAKGGGAAREGGSDPNLSASPTMTYAATQAGMVLGTAAYMSPEQARGKSVDRRTDIWSFGCVLFECLSGKPVFEGETISDLLARILERDPDWNALPARVPPRVRDLLKRCLVKDPRQRLRDIGDARLELEQVIALGISSPAAAAGAAMPRRGVPAWTLAAVALVAIAGTVFVHGMIMNSGARVARRFEVLAPAPLDMLPDPAECAISPDGRNLAMVLSDSAGTAHLWVRPLDSFKGREIAGTSGATMPFWSPHGRSIAFFAAGKLKKVAIAGGDPEVLCDVRSARGGSWSRDDVILFAPTSNGAIYSIPAGGGEPKAVTRLDSTARESAHRFPRFLPDGRHFLLSVLSEKSDNCSIEVASLADGSRRRVMSATSGVEYAPQGYLLFTRNAVLTAQRFDAGGMRLEGEPVSLGDSPSISNYSGSPAVTVADDGTMAYKSTPLPSIRMAWFDPDGREIGQVPLAPGSYTGLALSPDGRAALTLRIPALAQNELLLVDVERGTASRLSAPAENAESYSWSPDGRRVAYSVGNNTSQTIRIVPADGSGSAETVLKPGEDFRRLDGWTPDGQSLVIERLDPQTQWDLWILPLTGDRVPRLYLRTPANETGASVSPDGRWLSYLSDESGRFEAYVQSFPTPGSRYQVTTDGSGMVGWKRDGKVLGFGLTPDRVMRGVDVIPGASFRAGPPHRVARLPEQVFGADAVSDWSRFVALVPAGKQPQTSIRVVLDWTALLARR